VLVGVAGSPGALAVRRSFKTPVYIRMDWPVRTDKLWGVGPFAGRASWVVLGFERCRSVWLSANISFSFALTQKKQKVKAMHRS
jgi:hypothetical protein